MRLHIEHEDGSIQVLDFKPGPLRLGRNADCEVRFDHGRYPKVSSLHASLVPKSDQWFLKPLSRSNRTLVNDAPVSSPTAVSLGDRVRLGFSGPIIHLISLSGHDQAPARTMLAGDSAPVLQQLRQMTNLDVGDGGVIGRDSSAADFVLDHPHVSRAHCRIATNDDTLLIEDLGGANGTFINGTRITRQTRLADGDSVDVGPFTLEVRGDRLVGRSRKNNIQLVADRVGFVVPTEGKPGSTRLLQNIDLVVSPGEFVAIIGPSGSGKSTLLKALSGRDTPSEGGVYINERGLHANFAALKSDICVMPQSISLHDVLTVKQSLRYAASLRLSPDQTVDEIDEAVAGILEIVGLTARQDVPISRLSGGQLKRVGLAGELISDPSLLFLDEVTSGLDELADREMMRLFRQLAESKKTLVCVTHNLGHVADFCTHLAVLTSGGRLAFYGTPEQANRYFSVARLADIYQVLQRREPKTWASVFVKSKLFREHIASRKPAIQTQVSQAGGQTASIFRTASSWLRQFATIFSRTVAVGIKDPVASVTLIGQPLLVGVLLCLVFGTFSDLSTGPPLQKTSTTQNLLFLLAVSCFWLGCNTSVKELVKERSIYIRERDFSLIPEAYLASKLIYFAIIAILQSLALGIIVFSYFGPPGNIIGMLATQALSAVAGSFLGQAISANAKSEEAAIAAVPMVIIPQIILGGVVASLSGLSHWLAKIFATVFWSQNLLSQRLPEVDRALRDFTPSDSVSMSIIGLHMVVFLILAWCGVRRTGGRWRKQS